MNKKDILFVSNDFGRGLVSLARALSKKGFKVSIASSQSKNAKYLIGTSFFKLLNFNILKKQFLFNTKQLKNYITENQPIIHAFDDISSGMLKEYKHYNHPLDIGIDLDIYNPSSVSIPRTTKLLTEYNAQPHQKMITVISPLGVRLSNLMIALKKLDRDDYTIALLGTASRVKAKKISDSINQNQLRNKIILIGSEFDIPSLFRSSYAIMSLDNHSARLLKASIAMGRTTIWPINAFGIKPNVILTDIDANTIAKTIEDVLDLSAARRSAFEDQNLISAQNLSIQKTVQECLCLYKI